MPCYTVKIKWGKEVHNDIEANTDDDPMIFKAQIYALTGVKPERQKVMLKGAILKDDSWGNIKLSNGATVLMMGTKDEDVIKEPEVKPRFIEDMNESEMASAVDLPAGMHNLGNTCYMNATVQCLKTVPELRTALTNYNGAGAHPSDITRQFVLELRDLYSLMEKGPAVHPMVLLARLHTAFPIFSERGNDGNYTQQDANECWTEIIRMLQQRLPPIQDSNAKSFIEQYLGGRFEVELKCDEAEEEMVSKSNEDFLQLSCFITQDVKYMSNGLLNKLQEQITKHSTFLGRDATFTKTARVCRLPAYLTVQFVRFFYKENARTNAKILKDIKFPLEYDAYDLCTPELREKMQPYRKKFKELEENEVAKSMTGDVVKKEPVVNSIGNDDHEPFSFPDDLGSNNSGYYTLRAVLTHKGRSSSSGHYVGWVRYKKDAWLMCDDNNVTPVSSDDILKLSGGGDWHCAYVLLYGPKLLPKVSAPPPVNSAVDAGETQPSS